MEKEETTKVFVQILKNQIIIMETLNDEFKGGRHRSNLNQHIVATHLRLEGIL